MSEALINKLQTLSEIVALSGHEVTVRRALRPMLEDHVDEIRVDAMGNLITRKRGDGETKLRVMVTAHMDEVGLMVTDHTSDGGLRVDSVGGINAHLLPGLQVLVGEEQIAGVIGLKAIHRAKESEFSQAPALDKLVVDIGVDSKESAVNLAPVGTPIAFPPKFRELGATMMGKAFDDRGGCAILTTLLQGERFAFDLYGVFTAQEEVGLRGAYVAAYTVEPDIAFSLECTVADDLPKEEDEDVSPTTELGKGPAITVMDHSYVTPPHILRLLIEAAEAEQIPYQLKQPGISGTEPGAIHRAKGGVPSVTIAVPCRYIHSPLALMNRQDLENTLRLVRAALNRLTVDYLQLA